MSRGYALELLRWGTGDIHLSFWDALAGQDVIYRLHPDGRVDILSRDFEDEDPYVPIPATEFVTELCALLKAHEEQP